LHLRESLLLLLVAAGEVFLNDLPVLVHEPHVVLASPADQTHALELCARPRDEISGRVDRESEREVDKRNQERDQYRAPIIGAKSDTDCRDLSRHKTEPDDQQRSGTNEKHVSMLRPRGR
jgi:hypothetical protein